MTHRCQCGHEWTPTDPIVWGTDDGGWVDDDCPKCGRWVSVWADEATPLPHA